MPEIGHQIASLRDEPLSSPKSQLDLLIAAERAAQRAGGTAATWLSQLLALADVAMTDLNLDDVLGDALRAVAELLSADSVSFLVANPDGTELVARASVGLAEQVSPAVGIRAGAGVAGRVVATRQPVRIDDLDEVELASPLLRQSGIRSLVAAPVMSGDRVVGVLHAGSRRPGYFAADEHVALLSLVAERFAVAIERVRLFESELEARARAETISREIGHLQRITAAISADLDTESLARVLCQELSGDLGHGVVHCAMWLYNGSELVEPAELNGEETADSPGSIPLDSDFVQAEALRHGRPQWLSPAPPADRLFPSRRRPASAGARLVVLPLQIDDAKLGVMELGFSDAGEFAPDERDFYMAVAEQAAQAFDRARLRHMQEQTVSFNAFLAATSAALAESLDYSVTLDTVVRLIVPELADLATVHVREAGASELSRVALAHQDPEIEQAIRDAAEEHPVILEMLAAVAEGSTTLVEDLAGLLDDGSEVGGALAPLGMSAVLFVPLKHGTEVLGVLSLAQVGKSRSFDTATRLLVDEVGRRASVAVANARLHSEMAAARRAESYVLEIATVLAGVAGYEEALQQLAEIALPRFGDACLIDVVDDDGILTRVVALHTQAGRQHLLDQLQERYPPRHDPANPATAVVSHGDSQWSPQVSDDFLRSMSRDEEHYALMKELHVSSFITVPLASSGTVLGALTLLATEGGRRFDRSDLALTEVLADRVASVVAKARLYDREHKISHILQSNLMPTGLPLVPGFEIAVRYLPGTRDAEVGGDFYDAVVLPDRLLLVIGDVSGHDHQAAAVMGHLRTVVRTLAVLGEDPGGVIAAIQAEWDVLGLERMATVTLCSLDPVTGEMVAASAGHPPPLLISGGAAAFVPIRPAPLLGSVSADVRQWEGVLRAGEMMLFYTDGVIDNPRRGVDEGMSALAGLASGAGDPETLCESVATSMGEDRLDDVALLAISRV